MALPIGLAERVGFRTLRSELHGFGQTHVRCAENLLTQIRGSNQFLSGQ